MNSYAVNKLVTTGLVDRCNESEAFTASLYIEKIERNENCSLLRMKTHAKSAVSSLPNEMT